MKKAITVLGLGAAAVAISVTNASALDQQAQTSTSINLREQPSATSNKVSELKTGSKVTVKESQNGWANIQTEDGQSGWVSGYYVTNENGQSVVPAENTKVNPVTQSNVTGNNNEDKNITKINTVKNENTSNIKNNSEYYNSDKNAGNVDFRNAGSIVEDESSVNLNSNGRITSTPTLNLRTGPSTSYGVTGVINKDETFKVVSKATNGWYKVILSNGKTAWASGKYINLTSDDNIQVGNKKTSNNQVSSSSARGKVNSSVGLNVRSGAGTGNQVISTLNNNDDVEILGEESGWYKVRLADGSTGYVGASFISKTNGSIDNYSSEKNKSSENTDKDLVTNKQEVSVTKGKSSVINVAQSLLGTKYSWGGTSTSGFDCSGFTQYVYKKALGIDIPRVSRAQATAGKAVSVSNAMAGDLLYFDTMGSGTTSHVGIYLGNGKFIHASGTASNPEHVKISNLSESWVKCLGARRF